MSFSGYYSPRLFLTSLLPLLNEIPRFTEKNKFQQYQVQQFVFLRMEVQDRVWANYLKSECTPLQTALLFSLFDISVSHSALSPPELINSGSPNILPAYQGSLCKRSPTVGFQGQMKCNPSVSSHLKYTQCFFFHDNAKCYTQEIYQQYGTKERKSLNHTAHSQLLPK